MEIQIRDIKTGQVRPVPKAMWENQMKNSGLYELVSEDIREPMKVKPLDEVQEFINKAKPTECCKPDTDFIKICKEVETKPELIEPATEFLVNLLNPKEPKSKEPEPEDPPKVTKPQPVKRQTRKRK